MKWIIILMCCHIVTAWAQRWPLYEEPTLFVKFMQYDSSELMQQQQPTGIKRQAIYQGEDQLEPEMSYLTHNILERENFRIYHRSSYNFEGVKQKYASRQFNKIDANDFTVSLGYGMEYRIHHDEWMGYEYLSSFPQDQGQSIRVFWRKFF